MSVAPVALLVSLKELLLPYVDVVVPVFFVGFFLATLIAIVSADSRRVRNTYIGGVITLLLLTNLLVPAAPAPLTKWHKFSELRPVEQTQYEFRVVDASGNEIDYDEDATWKASGIGMNFAHEEVLDGTPEEQEVVARYLLHEAREHRAEIRNRSLLHFVRFLPHGTAGTWTESELAAYDRFVAIRLYRMNISTSADGTEITSYSEEVVYEYRPNGTDDGTMTATTARDAPRELATPAVAKGVSA